MTSHVCVAMKPRQQKGSSPSSRGRGRGGSKGERATPSPQRQRQNQGQQQQQQQRQRQSQNPLKQQLRPARLPQLRDQLTPPQDDEEFICDFEEEERLAEIRATIAFPQSMQPAALQADKPAPSTDLQSLQRQMDQIRRKILLQEQGKANAKAVVGNGRRVGGRVEGSAAAPALSGGLAQASSHVAHLSKVTGSSTGGGSVGGGEASSGSGSPHHTGGGGASHPGSPLRSTASRGAANATASPSAHGGGSLAEARAPRQARRPSARAVAGEGAGAGGAAADRPKQSGQCDAPQSVGSGPGTAAENLQAATFFLQSLQAGVPDPEPAKAKRSQASQGQLQRPAQAASPSASQPSAVSPGLKPKRTGAAASGGTGPAAVVRPRSAPPDSSLLSADSPTGGRTRAVAAGLASNAVQLQRARPKGGAASGAPSHAAAQSLLEPARAPAPAAAAAERRSGAGGGQGAPPQGGGGSPV